MQYCILVSWTTGSGKKYLSFYHLPSENAFMTDDFQFARATKEPAKRANPTAQYSLMKLIPFEEVS